MNSESLQKNFPEVYANFMVANDIVVGANYSIPWGGAVVGHRSKYLRTYVKVPLICHVGLRRRRDAKINFGNVASFDITKGEFETFPYQKTNPEHEKTAAAIRAYLDERGYREGVDISILSETTRGHGLGYTGVSSVALVVGLERLISKSGGEPGKKNATAPNPFHFAWKLEFIARYGNTLGEGVHLALSEASVSFHCCSQFDETMSPDRLETVEHYVRHLSGADDKPLSASDLPMDFCVVYSGHPTDTRQVELFRSADRRAFEGCASTVRDSLFGGKIPADAYVAKFAKGKTPYDAIQDALVALNVRTVESFMRIAKNGFDHSTADDLADNANQYRHVLAAAEKQDGFAEKLSHRFASFVGTGSEKAGIVPCYTGKSGGGYVVTFKPGQGRVALEKAVDSLRSDYPETALEYASWIDGSSSSGPKVEHDPFSGVKSPLIPADCTTFRDNRGKTYLGSYATIMENERDCLLLDAVEMKLSVHGSRPTSKDIPSQSVTIEALSRLLLHPGEDVASSSLPSSSYSKDKGLLMSKAIAPLVNYVKTVTGKDLPMTCNGSSGKFSLSLGTTDLRIGLVYR